MNQSECPHDLLSVASLVLHNHLIGGLRIYSSKTMFLKTHRATLGKPPYQSKGKASLGSVIARLFNRL